MLSRVLSSKNINKNKLEKLIVPTTADLKDQMEKLQMEMERQQILNLSDGDIEQTAKKEAEKILADAQKKLRETELDIVNRKKQIEEQTKAEMTKIFDEKMEKELSESKEKFLSTLKQISALKKRMFQENEKELLELVFLICEKIIAEKVNVSEDMVMNLLKKGMKKLSNTKIEKLILNPLDFDMITKNQTELLSDIEVHKEISFEKDDSIERGSCVIKTQKGQLNTSPRQQLEILRDEFFKNA